MDKQFSGSYDPQDVHILLKPVQMEFVDVRSKEASIQSKERHYSEMLSAEQLPSAQYMSLFMQAMDKNAARLARDIVHLAKILLQNKMHRQARTITLVSLARAGTPIGVLLKRALHALGESAAHYSISIIRDREIDTKALQHILQQENVTPASLFFIDGWTGKGVIGRELKKFIKAFYHSDAIQLYDELYVVADLCGDAAFCATSDDYLIPSGILNAIISGLVSRSILNADVVGAGDFHACVFYEEWMEQDLSNWFVQRIAAMIEKCVFEGSGDKNVANVAKREHIFLERRKFLQACLQEHGVSDINLIKPGIAEATRVLLRRVPELVYIREKNHVETRHLEALAEEKSVRIIFDRTLPYLATAVIQSLR